MAEMTPAIAEAIKRTAERRSKEADCPFFRPETSNDFALLCQVVRDLVSSPASPAATAAESVTLREAVTELLEALGHLIAHHKGGGGGPDPESWECTICGETWETKRHEPGAHAADCSVRKLYAALTAAGQATPSELDAAIRDVCQRHLAQRALWDRYAAGEASDKLIDDIFASAAAVGAAIDRLRTAAGEKEHG